MPEVRQHLLLFGLMHVLCVYECIVCVVCACDLMQHKIKALNELLSLYMFPRDIHAFGVASGMLYHICSLHTFFYCWRNYSEAIHLYFVVAAAVVVAVAADGLGTTKK